LLSRSAHRQIDNLFEKRLSWIVDFIILHSTNVKERLLQALEIAASLPTFKRGSIYRLGRTFGGIMKYVCFGYFDEEAWTALSESEQQRFIDECFAYDDVLRKNGLIGGEALQTVRNAKTLRFRNGKVMITDGPYAETKEQIGGFFSFEARDMDEAVRLVSNHPGLKAGPFEIRPVEDMTEMIRESERRRSQTNRT
jgi:hypothetical protein